MKKKRIKYFNYTENHKFHFKHSRRKEQECEIAQLKAENEMIRKHRLGPKNIPLPQVPAKIGSLRNSNSTSSQETSFDDGNLQSFPTHITFKYILDSLLSP